MFECPTCGGIFESDCRYSGTKRHVKKCEKSTPEQRNVFKTTGHWPRRESKVARRADQASV